MISTDVSQNSTMLLTKGRHEEQCICVIIFVRRAMCDYIRPEWKRQCVQSEIHASHVKNMSHVTIEYSVQYIHLKTPLSQWGMIRVKSLSDQKAHTTGANPGFFFSTSPWMECQSITGVSPSINLLVSSGLLIHPGGDTVKIKWPKVSCSRVTQHSASGHGSNPEFLN